MKRTYGFGCFAKAILMRHIHQNNAPTITAVSHCHTRTLNNGEKMKICKKHQSFEVIG